MSQEENILDYNLLSALKRKSHLCVPFLGIARLSPNFHIHVSVSDLYIARIGLPYMFPAAEQADRYWENRNCVCGRPIPFLGIFVSNFRYRFFADAYAGNAGQLNSLFYDNYTVCHEYYNWCV